MTTTLGRVLVAGTLAMTLGMAGCTGEQGPPGPQGLSTDGEKGATGLPGKDGAKGEPGPQGAAAESAKITNSIFCTGGLEGTASLGFKYQAVLFANGNVFASASIKDGVLEASYATLYSPTQNGAAVAGVSVQFDQAAPANSGFWILSLDRKTLVTSIVYNDADVLGGTQSWTMTPAACVVNNY